MDSLPQRPEAPPPPHETRRIVVAAVRPRAILGVIAIVVAVAAGLWLLWLSKRIITWVLIAMFLAAALNPAVQLFQRRLRFRKVPAISLTFLMLIVATGGIALLLAPPLIDAGGQLANDAPGYVDRLARTRLFRELDQRYDLATRLKDFVNTLPDHLGGAGTAVDVAQRLLSGFVGGVTVLVLTFMFLIYGPQLRATSVAAMPGHLQARINAVLDKMYRSVGGYVAGNLLVSLVAGVFAYAALKILGVPAAAALAFWVGIADLVPLVGATVGAIPAVIVAFFSGGWIVGVIMIAYFIVYQQVENHFVQPLVMRRTTNLNPLLTLIAVILGAELLGIVGALLAIPAASMIKIVAEDLWAHRRGARPPADATEPPRADTPTAT